MHTQLPNEKADRGPTTAPTDEERQVLQRFADAFEHADVATVAALLREDARWEMPPAAYWFEGKVAMVALFEKLLGPESPGDFRFVPTSANRQLGVACYLRLHGDSEFRLSGLNLLRIQGGEIAEITSFSPELLRPFDLPPTL